MMISVEMKYRIMLVIIIQGAREYASVTSERKLKVKKKRVVSRLPIRAKIFGILSKPQIEIAEAII